MEAELKLKEHRNPFRLFHLWIPIAAITIILSFTIPEDGSVYSLISPFPIDSECMMRRVTGLSCGTCGMTGAFSSIARFKLETALLKHPLGIPLFLAIVSFGILAFCDLIGLKRISRLWFDFVENRHRSIFIILLLVFFSIYFIRMIGEIEAGYLKPGGIEKMFFLWFFMFNYNT